MRCERKRTMGLARRLRGGHRRGVATLAGVAVAVMAVAVACGEDAGPGPRLNELQVLGTHNSYHVEPSPPLLGAIASFIPDFAASISYSHVPLGQQLDEQGVRQLELDVFADPNGGLFANRAGPALLGGSPASGEPELDAPGFKVLHVQDLDFRSTCLTLVSCLQEIKTWSDANAEHLPLLVMIEVKDDPIPDPLNAGFVIPHEVGVSELDALDAEIRSVFGPDDLLTPDDVRGEHASLEEAVLASGWPRLSDIRGRVMFVLYNREKRELYVQAHPSLEGRVMFTNSEPGAPDAAFMVVDDPVADGARIRELVTMGYLVRTRADADTIEARMGDTARRDAAFASGAHFVSTDFPVARESFGTGYAVALPDGATALCNPVSASVECVAEDLGE